MIKGVRNGLDVKVASLVGDIVCRKGRKRDRDVVGLVCELKLEGEVPVECRTRLSEVAL